MNCDYSPLEDCAICFQCSVQKLILTKQNQSVTEINGIIPLGFSPVDVKTLKAVEQIIYFLPSQINLQFPYMKVLKVWSSGLREIHQEDIRDLKFLTDLSLSGNFLETLDSNLFQFNQKLIKVDFTRNRIKHVGTNLLKPLKNLMLVDFYQNYCISDGSRRYALAQFKLKLREMCQPTREMMVRDIELLITESESLRREIEKKSWK